MSGHDDRWMERTGDTKPEPWCGPRMTKTTLYPKNAAIEYILFDALKVPHGSKYVNIKTESLPEIIKKLQNYIIENIRWEVNT